jgi:hypothetical protein
METPEPTDPTPEKRPKVEVVSERKEPLLDITSQHKTQPMNKISSRAHLLAGLQIQPRISVD